MLIFIYLILFIGYLGYEGLLLFTLATAISYQDKLKIKLAAAIVFIGGNIMMINSIIVLLF